jgi:hypothetical protein
MGGEFWKTWRDAWETVTIRVERVEDLGDDVLVLVTFDGVGRGSGASYPCPSAKSGHLGTGSRPGSTYSTRRKPSKPLG